jgi:hypothetical protein
MAFQKGKSGNPAGRRPGSKDVRTGLRELMRPHAPKLVQTCVNMALAGDTHALKICMDRLVSPIREDFISVSIPKIAGPDDCTSAQAAVLNAVAAGEMLPTEGTVLSGLINAQRLAYETSHLAKQLASIEADLAKIKERNL